MQSIKYYKCPAGILELVIQNDQLIETRFIDTLAPKDVTFINHIPPLALEGTEFQSKVWQAALKIPSGKTTSYKELAQSIGHPASWRAVANALGQNKIAYFIPCHRVIGSNGSLAGYKWGIERKKMLLEAENISKSAGL